MIQSGDKAPNFTLYDTNKKEHVLSDYLGKNVLVLFFPQAFTSVCTAELCSIRDELSIYNNLNSEVLAISTNSIFTLAKYKEEQAYNFTLLSDWNQDASRTYETLYDEFVFGMRGVSKRSAFVLDKDGIIQYAEVLESARDIPDFVKIKETLSSLS